ncbi:putative enoyl-CoA hydratase echA8 [Sporotomaculum syntrophicum]|uniref:short-chain-enoyl-CoA hydratase n=1 Tax=Sporotomaculum syntrophicum TaxID=182264 RepID=A0A9D2WPA1_9FIRM|nr:enoyl-CoA hydratase-related protein [Sporotomaculum syntrophicum]KAF1084635.1 putative enoyl-CoA hydratase echA8 [Sporotomaculum syntrophicum]
MGWNNILLEKENEIAVLTINRPDVLNALDAETLQEIGTAMDQLDNDNEVRVVILTGAGSKAFVAGADIAYMQKLTPMEAKNFSRIGQKAFSKIENLSKPVIAAINGFALGGGCELAMACDIRIASDNAKLGQPEVSLGINAGFGATQRLPRLVNPGIAKEMLFTGDYFSAERAKSIGLVNDVVPAAELMKYCMNMAKRIAARAPIAVQLTKEAINDGLEMDLEKGFIHEADIFGVAFSTEDRDEGFASYLDKRKPEFKGK